MRYCDVLYCQTCLLLIVKENISPSYSSHLTLISEESALETGMNMSLPRVPKDGRAELWAEIVLL